MSIASSRRRSPPSDLSCLCNDAGFIKAKPGAARVKLCGIAVADVAKKVRLPGRLFEKRLIHLGVIESRHRPSIQSKRAGGEDEIGALQSAVAEGSLLAQ